MGLADDEDPRIRRVYQRLRRLTIIAGLTMGLGFLSVMSVIAYRLVKAPSKTVAPRMLALPSGAKLLSVQVDGGRVVATVEEAGRTVVHIFDAGTLTETGRLEIGPGAPDAPPLR